ncbi:Type I restriction modification DNA specificity domain-containing protein [Psychrobacter okhotskensis]|uniref:restriction endonuclease subunit S n=1 Tax=Psychrobacter okhotskensis TaxID=212403 RepID=UPI003F544AF5
MVHSEISKLELIQARISFIPKGWQLDKVGEALNIKNNFRKPISQEVRSLIPGPYPYYGPTKIQDHIADYEQDGTYALIGEDGDHFLKYESMRQTQFISGKCTVNNHAHIIESSNTCDSEWFYLYFQHRNITNFLSRQGAGRFKLNKVTLEKLPLLVPPLLEQRKIVKILSTWDKAISTTERLIDNSTQQKKALMQQLLIGKKRLLDGLGQRFEGEWEEVSIGSTSKCFSGGTPSRTKDEYYNGSIPWITSGKLNDRFVDSVNEYITELGLQNSSAKIVKNGSILVAMYGATAGKVALNTLDSATVNQAVLALEPKEKFHNLFLFYLLEVEMLKALLLVQGGQPNLSATIIKAIKIKVPALLEQQKIATVLTNADKEIELLEQQLADLQQEKKALMQVLLTGKVRVRVDGEDV